MFDLNLLNQDNGDMYRVYVIEHFTPDDDPGKTYSSGVFETKHEAENKCKNIIKGFFEDLDLDKVKKEKDLSIESLYKKWRWWGETPFVKPSKTLFDADKYAKECAEKLLAKIKG